MQLGKGLTSAKTSTLMDYFLNDKSEYEIVQLCGFCAIRLMIGRKGKALATYGRIINLMFPNNNNLKTKYEKRYHYEKLIDILEDEWGLIKQYHYSRRSFYVSFKLNYNILAKADKQAKQRKQKRTENKRLAIENANKVQ